MWEWCLLVRTDLVQCKEKTVSLSSCFDNRWISVLTNSKEEALTMAFRGEQSTGENSLEDLTKAIIEDVQRLPGNDVCCDCGSSGMCPRSGVVLLNICPLIVEDKWASNLKSLGPYWHTQHTFPVWMTLAVCYTWKVPTCSPCMLTCQNATLPSEVQLNGTLGSMERALDMESIILILNHQPAVHCLDDLMLSPFTILIFRFLILKMG